MGLLIACILLLLVLVGCAPYPRYRTGGPEVPATVEPKGIRWKTSEYVRLGLILEEYLGKPYKGTSKYDRGLDCSDFTESVYRRYNGTKLPSTAAAQFQTGREIHRNLIGFGDLVFFRTNGHRITHVGISVGYNEFIHASSSRGVIISSLLEDYWSKRYAGARRIIE